MPYRYTSPWALARRTILMLLIMLLLVTAPLAGCGGGSGSSSGPDLPDKGVLERIRQTVDGQREMETLEYLCSDELRGRPAGSDEAEKAADYIEEIFSSFGLGPVDQFGLSGLSQSFQVPSELCFTEIPPLTPQVTCRNIIGSIRGSQEPESLVIITANYDSMGVDPDSQEIYRGADFNASGTSAVVELARVFTELRLSPRQTVVFACLGAEECGGFGSKALADMIEQQGMKGQVQIVNLQGLGAGPGDYMDVWDQNYRKNRPIAERLENAAEFCGVPMERGGSDQGSPASLFFVYHIPAVNCDWSWADGDEHPDFHLTTDDPDRIDREAVGASTQVAGVATWLLSL